MLKNLVSTDALGGAVITIIGGCLMDYAIDFHMLGGVAVSGVFIVLGCSMLLKAAKGQ